MRQTRKAITFLMAQYRAILHNAALYRLPLALPIASSLLLSSVAQALPNPDFDADFIENNGQELSGTITISEDTFASLAINTNASNTGSFTFDIVKGAPTIQATTQTPNAHWRFHSGAMIGAAFDSDEAAGSLTTDTVTLVKNSLKTVDISSTNRGQSFLDANTIVLEGNSSLGLTASVNHDAILGSVDPEQRHARIELAQPNASIHLKGDANTTARIHADTLSLTPKTKILFNTDLVSDEAGLFVCNNAIHVNHLAIQGAPQITLPFQGNINRIASIAINYGSSYPDWTNNIRFDIIADTIQLKEYGSIDAFYSEQISTIQARSIEVTGIGATITTRSSKGLAITAESLELKDHGSVFLSDERSYSNEGAASVANSITASNILLDGKGSTISFISYLDSSYTDNLTFRIGAAPQQTLNLKIDNEASIELKQQGDNTIVVNGDDGLSIKNKGALRIGGDEALDLTQPLPQTWKKTHLQATKLTLQNEGAVDIRQNQVQIEGVSEAEPLHLDVRNNSSFTTSAYDTNNVTAASLTVSNQQSNDPSATPSTVALKGATVSADIKKISLHNHSLLSAESKNGTTITTDELLIGKQSRVISDSGALLLQGSSAPHDGARHAKTKITLDNGQLVLGDNSQDVTVYASDISMDGSNFVKFDPSDTNSGATIKFATTTEAALFADSLTLKKAEINAVKDLTVQGYDAYTNDAGEIVQSPLSLQMEEGTLTSTGEFVLDLKGGSLTATKGSTVQAALRQGAPGVPLSPDDYGRFVLRDGIFDFAQGTHFYAEKQAGTTLPIIVSDEATLKLFSSDLSTTALPHDKTSVGIKVDAAVATIELKDDAPVDLQPLIATDDDNYQGKIRVSSDDIEARIKVPTLHITEAFTAAANVANTTLEAKNLTLGSSSSSQVFHNFGSAQATQSLTIASKETITPLKDTVSLVAPEGQQGTVALAGKAKQLVINADGDNGQLLVKAGNWATSADLSIEGDGLIIEGSTQPKAEDPTQQQAFDTRLTVTGDIDLKRGSLVVGTESSDKTIGTATLDASQAHLKLSQGAGSSSSDVVTIIGKDKSHIALDANSVETAFAQQRLRAKTTQDSSLLQLQASGKDAVLELTGSEATLHDADIADFITLSHGARVKSENTLNLVSSQAHIIQKAATLTLDEGGIFEASTLSLKTPKYHVAPSIEVSGGELIAHNELSSSVNHIKLNTTPLHLERTEAGAGTVTPSLLSNDTLSVVGEWHAQDVAMRGEKATLTVGATGKQGDNNFTSKFVVDAVSLKDNATVSIAQDAVLTARSMTADTAHFKIDGYMEVLGSTHLPHNGFALKGQIVNVNPTGTFSLGPVPAETVAHFVLQDKSISPYFGHYAVDGGLLQFQLPESIILSSAQYARLRDEMATLTNGGSVSIGDAKLSDVEEIVDQTTNTASWNDIKSILNNVHSTIQNELQELTITVDGSKKGEETATLDRAHIGAVALNEDAELNINNQDENGVTVLSGADKNNNKFVSQGEKPGDVTVEQGGLRLEGNGEIGTISFTDNEDSSFVVISGSQVVTGDITGSQSRMKQPASGLVNVTDGTDMSFGKLSNIQELNIGNDVKTTFRDEVNNVQNITTESDLNFDHEVSIGSLVAPNNVVTFGADSTIDTAQVKKAIVKEKAQFNNLTQKSGDVVLAKKQHPQDQDVELIINKLESHGGQIEADKLFASNMSLSGNAKVKADYVELHGSVEIGSDTKGTGSFEAQKLSLNGQRILIDPDYSERAAVITISSFGNAPEGSIGSLDGHLIIGQNAIAGIGVTSAEELLQHPKLDFIFNEHYSLSKQYNAVMYVNDHMSIDPNCSIILDKRPDIGAQYKTTDLGSQSSQLVLENNTALILNGEKLSADQAYITFKDDSPLIAAAKDVVIFVTPNLATQSFVLFDSAGDIKFKEGDGYNDFVLVSSSNGLFTGKLEAKNGVVDGRVSLGFDEQKAEQVLSGVSSPVKQTMIDYFSQSQNAAAPHNELIRRSLYNSNGADLETVARFAVYGGAVESALVAGATTSDAIFARMGVSGAQQNSITFADNGQGAGLWVRPIYKNHESDGFSAQGIEYGADIDMYGLALGADYTLAHGLRIGAAFNVGSGDADGKGAGSDVKNDFNYYGFAAYAGYAFDSFALVGDVSYTVTDNDVEGDIATVHEKVSSSMDSANISAGVSAQCAFTLGGVEVVPHAGVRYNSINLDDYSVKGSTDYASYNAERMDIISVPVGVSFAKDFAVGAWTVKPSIDLTVTGTLGDDDAEGTVSWSGGDDLYSKVATEVLDDVTYGAKLGLVAGIGMLKIDLGLNYTGSDNTNDFGVNAQAHCSF